MLRSERLACLGRLAAVVAHELNNPLAGVVVYARRAQKALAVADFLAPERRREIAEWMATIDRELGRCGRIVQDLLAFSRRESPVRSPVQVNDLVRQAARLLNHKLSLEDVILELELDEKLPPLVANGGQIEQALLALMINAVEAMPEGGALKITTREHPGGGVDIVVEDTGVGIAPDILPHVLEPFFTTKPEGQGTGLGLSVVYGIVSRHGGRLDFSSTPGAGTRVTMFFPQISFGGDAAAGAAPAAGAPEVKA
jgi:two-component system NtrC family sensor kinase